MDNVIYHHRFQRSPTTEAESRVRDELQWARRARAEFDARWDGPHRPLLYSAWLYRVRCFRREFPQRTPETAPWDTLWTALLIECPSARRDQGTTATDDKGGSAA